MPQQTLLTDQEDTRAQETLGTMPFKSRSPNRGLMLVSIAVIVLLAAVGLFAYTR